MDIVAKIKKIIYHNLSSNYWVLNIIEENGQETVVIAKEGTFLIKENYQFSLVHTLSAKYGDQWEVTKAYRLDKPSIEGISKYLLSLKLAGIGKIKANFIATTLGETFFTKGTQQLSDYPNLREKLSEKQIMELTKVLAFNSQVEECKRVLFTYGLSQRIVAKLVELWPLEALEKVQNNPYILIDEIDGISFKKADEIALKVGIDESSSERFKAAILHILKEQHLVGGHSYVFLDDIARGFRELINIECPIAEILAKLEKENKIVIIDNKYYLTIVYATERKLAKKLLSLQQETQLFDNADEYIESIHQLEQRYHITYTPTQSAAISTALKNKVAIITGGPGTGKTTITKAILEIYLKNNPQKKFKLCAPTGKAAKRLASLIQAKATTIHMMLEFDKYGKFKYDENHHLDVDFLIIDEASMLDLYLANSLFASLNPQTKVLIIGDVNQLPSIAPGQVLYDLINSQLFACAYLKEIMRNSTASNIPLLASQLLNNTLKITSFRTNDVVIKRLDTSEVIAWLKAFYLDQIQKNLAQKTLILAPKRNGVLGIDNINKEIQDFIITNKEKYFLHYGNKFYPQDMIIQTRNDYTNFIMNGQIGKIQSLKILNDEPIVEIDFGEDGASDLHTYPTALIQDIDLAYALSIHKSQGSEADDVVLIISKEAQFMLNRELIYTAITRAKKKLFILGEPGLISYYMRKIALRRRTSLFLN
ncbi:MAG: AAA family ATPase [Acholeplasmatales bacterium]|jgi:exodeoxyribonuclease V alpha subunit|nr:AAA family ATPase [Acholeplasmatales bacterium]